MQSSFPRSNVNQTSRVSNYVTRPKSTRHVTVTKSIFDSCRSTSNSLCAYVYALAKSRGCVLCDHCFQIVYCKIKTWLYRQTCQTGYALNENSLHNESKSRAYDATSYAGSLFTFNRERERTGPWKERPWDHLGGARTRICRSDFDFVRTKTIP